MRGQERLLNGSRSAAALGSQTMEPFADRVGFMGVVGHLAMIGGRRWIC
jgi:hypothetical protein